MSLCEWVWVWVRLCVCGCGCVCELVTISAFSRGAAREASSLLGALTKYDVLTPPPPRPGCCLSLFYWSVQKI